MSSTVLITGANRGVGLALACHYAEAGGEVIGVCRGIAERIGALTLATSGGFWHSNSELLPW